MTNTCDLQVSRRFNLHARIAFAETLTHSFHPLAEGSHEILLALGVASARHRIPAFASAELAQKKNCLACHAADKK